jgi:hypothetical protein
MHLLMCCIAVSVGHGLLPGPTEFTLLRLEIRTSACCLGILWRRRSVYRYILLRVPFFTRPAKLTSLRL